MLNYTDNIALNNAIRLNKEFLATYEKMGEELVSDKVEVIEKIRRILSRHFTCEGYEVTFNPYYSVNSNGEKYWTSKVTIKSTDVSSSGVEFTLYVYENKVNLTYPLYCTDVSTTNSLSQSIGLMNYALTNKDELINDIFGDWELNYTLNKINRVETEIEKLKNEIKRDESTVRERECKFFLKSGERFYKRNSCLKTAIQIEKVSKVNFTFHYVENDKTLSSTKTRPIQDFVNEYRVGVWELVPQEDTRGDGQSEKGDNE